MSEVEQYEGHQAGPTADGSASMMDNGRRSSEIAFGILGGSGREPRSGGEERRGNLPFL